MPVDSIPQRLLKQGAQSSDRIAYRVREGDGVWAETGYGEYARQVRAAAKALIALDFQPGDKLCILGFNRPEWVIADLAAMMAGGVPAGIYTTCSPPEVRYIVDHADAAVVFLENRHQWEKIDAERAKLPKLKHAVMMKGAEAITDPLAMSWEAFTGLAEGIEDSALDARLEGIAPGDPATFIYTSGTTGPPKAVMLSHENLTFTADAALEMVSMTLGDHSLSYLPLSHIAEQMFSLHAPITAGTYISFAESIARVPDNLKEVQPTVIFGVPRIWEKMHAKVGAGLAQATGLKAKLVAWALRVGAASVALRNRGLQASGSLAFQYKLADKLIFSKLKLLMGLSEARVCVSGAAPISKEVLEFFAGLDLSIHEVYGQSEDTGPTTFNMPGRTRLGTVGPPVPGVEVKIAADGEILVRGKNVFLGYYKNQADTDEALIDGWLHSGDLGAFDDEGFLNITGRKKEIIITAGGKNIAPKNIEAALKDLPLVSQAVVIGDRRKFLSALLTLDPEAAAAFAGGRGIDGAALSTDSQIIQALQEGIDGRVNPQFARVEHIRKFTVLHRDFSIDANDRGRAELTPTLKIKRAIVNDNFADEIESMYA